jgi:hypothetical protein
MRYIKKLATKIWIVHFITLAKFIGYGDNMIKHYNFLTKQNK